MNRVILSIAFLVLTLSVSAQEFNCRCSVNAPALQTTDKEVFKDLESRINDFFNKNVWTADRYQPEEKINCSINLNITQELSNTSFAAELIINASRPVFNSGYTTPLINYQDRNVSFDFQELQNLVFTENNFTDNLSSILLFYGYIMLAQDYDSFSPYGGEKYIAKAQEVVNSVPPQLLSSSWGNVTDNSVNRVTMVESFLSPRIRTLRKAYYDYHRLGLDVMSEKPAEGRQSILNALDAFGIVGAKLTDDPYIRLFTTAKGSEVINMFSIAERAQKLKAYDVMIKIDPANASTYNVIKR